MPSIPQIVVELYTGVGIRLYETGDIDMTGVSSTDAQTVLDPANPLHPDLLTGVSLCTNYVTFDVTKPPFDDVKVRQAFTMAFDRQKFIDVVNNGVGVLAKGLYPPAMPGYNLDLKGLPLRSAAGPPTPGAIQIWRPARASAHRLYRRRHRRKYRPGCSSHGRYVGTEPGCEDHHREYRT